MILEQEGEIMKVGIEVVTGFLGAGKSAFINSLIKTTKAVGEKIIVLTCEIGNVKIKEFKEKDLFVKHINFMEDNAELDKNIYKIINEYKPHRIIIEYNGTETLEYLYKCIFDNKIGKLINLNTMYFVCNGESINFYIKNMGEILLPFIQNSDVIAVNNCSNLNERDLEEGINILEALNHKAQIIIVNDNNNFEEALNKSNLIESDFLRNIRVKLMDYMRK